MYIMKCNKCGRLFEAPTPCSCSICGGVSVIYKTSFNQEQEVNKCDVCGKADVPLGSTSLGKYCSACLQRLSFEFWSAEIDLEALAAEEKEEVFIK